MTPASGQGGRENAMRRRLTALLAMVMLAVMVATALPALAAPPAPTKEECLGVQAALNQGEQLTGQQKQLIRQFPNLGQCIAASEG
jgi:hypothetical protein